MTLQMWLENLAAYSIQVAVLVAAGTALVLIFRLRMPNVLLALWQGLLAICLLMPVFQPWQPAQRDLDATQQGPTSILAEDVTSPVAGLSSASHGIAAEPLWLARFPVYPSILLILVAGIGLRAAWMALGVWRLHRYRTRSRRPAALPEAIREMQWRLAVRPEILFSAEIDTPVTFGWRRPAVIFPESFAAMDETMQRPVACHELIHVLRRDWLHVVVEEILRSLFWFHPAIWWALGRIHLSREQVVDREVLRVTGKRGPYLESLLHIASLRGRPAAVPAPLLLRERHLVERVALMLKESAMTRTRLIASLAIAAACLILTGTLAAGWFPLTAPPAAAPVPVPAPAAQVSPPAQSPEDPVLLNYDNSNLVNFIRTVSNILGLKPIEIDPDVMGTVTFHSAKPLSKSEVKQVFDDVLKKNQAALVKSGDSYRVVRLPEPGGTPRAPTPAAKSTQRAPLRVGGNVQMSKLIRKVAPLYPEAARSANVEGNVMLDMRIDEAGMVSEVRVIRGHPLLDQAAIDAVRQWRYQPTLLNGEPVPVQTTVSISFSEGGVVRIESAEFVAPVEVPPRTPSQTTVPFATAPRIEPLRVGGNVQESRIIHKVDPVYPEGARQARISGIVMLEVTVNEAGEVATIRVIRGHPLLDQAAVDAVRQWRYEPTYLNGVAVPVIATATVIFNPGSSAATPALSLRVNPQGELIRLDSQGQLDGSGSVQLIPDKEIPFAVLEQTLQSLQSKQVAFRLASSMYAFAAGRLFYNAPPAGADARLVQMAGIDPGVTSATLDVDMERLAAIAKSSGIFPSNANATAVISYTAYVSERGEIVDIRDSFGGKLPEIVTALRQARVLSPGRRSSQAVPTAVPVRITIK